MLFAKRKKIPCFVLIYDQQEIIEKCLSFLVSYSHFLDIIVIENPSNNTPKISEFVKSLGERGKIRQYYLFKSNITNNAMTSVLEENIELIECSPYVMITDGDITCDDRKWIKEELNILKHNKDVFTCGITLSRSNLPLNTFPEANDWLPSDKAEHEDYYETVTGTHLQLIHGTGLASYLRWIKDSGLHSVDSSMHEYCEGVLGMKWARTKHAEAIHLTWDLYKDLEHPYTRHRLSKTSQETWHHKNISTYTLHEF